MSPKILLQKTKHYILVVFINQCREVADIILGAFINQRTTLLVFKSILNESFERPSRTNQVPHNSSRNSEAVSTLVVPCFLDWEFYGCPLRLPQSWCWSAASRSVLNTSCCLGVGHVASQSCGLVCRNTKNTRSLLLWCLGQSYAGAKIYARQFHPV